MDEQRTFIKADNHQTVNTGDFGRELGTIGTHRTEAGSYKTVQTAEMQKSVSSARGATRSL